jgi:hypothetical protein
MSLTGEQDGTCHPIMSGLDPNNECPGMASTCDGSGACQ